jgi:hypothetical protein
MQPPTNPKPAPPDCRAAPVATTTSSIAAITRSLCRAVAHAVNAAPELIEDACQTRLGTICCDANPIGARSSGWLTSSPCTSAYRLCQHDPRDLHLETLLSSGSGTPVVADPVSIDDILEAREVLMASGRRGSPARRPHLLVGGFATSKSLIEPARARTPTSEAHRKARARSGPPSSARPPQRGPSLAATALHDVTHASWPREPKDEPPIASLTITVKASRRPSAATWPTRCCGPRVRERWSRYGSFSWTSSLRSTLPPRRARMSRVDEAAAGRARATTMSPTAR